MLKVLIIVPAYNEEANIASVVGVLRDSGYDFVVVNDGSTDRTRDILEQIDAPHVDLIQNLGIGGGVQTGYIYAYEQGYDVAIQFDGDGQHDAGCIPDLVAPIEAGEANIVVGSRFVSERSEFKSSLARRMGIKILSTVLKMRTGMAVKDITSGFRAADRQAIELFTRYYPDDYPEPESLVYANAHGLKVGEVPVVMHERQGGSSSISGFKPLYYMVKVSLAMIMCGKMDGGR